MAVSLMHFEKTLPAEMASGRAGAVLRWRYGINKKQMLVDALLWCALAVFLVLGVVNAGALRVYPHISLRYDKPVSGQAAYQARQYSIEHSEDDSFWPTFWHEAQAGFENEYNSTSASCILFSGDATLVWPAQYLIGVAPGVTDGVGCAVSASLAWELWGGVDVVGKSVEVDDETRIVRGVFEGENQLALLSIRDEDTSRSFTAVELSLGPDDPTRDDVRSFATSAGLGSPNNILIGTPVSLAFALAAVPIIIIAIYVLALCIARLKVRPAAMWGILLFAFIVFAFTLPGLLDMLPGWMIPTRWSDFSFWGGLTSQVGDNLREYLIVAPKLRDVEYKVLLLKQICIAFFSTGLALSVCLTRRSAVTGVDYQINRVESR